MVKERRLINMDFYTVVLRKSGIQHVALCLENGLVGQGITKEDSIKKLKGAIDSFEDVYKNAKNITLSWILKLTDYLLLLF